MKHLLFLIFLFAWICCGADASDITMKVSEIDQDKDGKPEVRVERVFRGQNEILQTLRSTKKPGITTTARTYSVGGDLIMIESDEDGDGFFEKIAIYHPTKKDMEVFVRQTDGSVRPVDTGTLEAYKKQNAAIGEFWDKAFQKKLSDDELSDLMRETRKKVSDAENEKRDTSANPREQKQ